VAFRRPTLLSLSTRAGRSLPTALLRRLAGQALAPFHVALCLHRVAPRRRPTDWQPALTHEPGELDAAVELLLSARPPHGDRWLTLAFDDGYVDSLEYIATRAPRFPDVDFRFFICPAKVERRAGFRWDLVERALARGVPRAEALSLLDAPVDLATENDRADLRALGDDPDFRLATVDQLRQLQSLPNVLLGPHTNVHLRATALPDDVVREEYRQSVADFTRLFGPPREVAFPFGTPAHEFDARHVEMWRALGDFPVWTTEPRPFRPEERQPRAVLPRFGADGRFTAAELVGWVTARAVKFAARGSDHRFP
jgi:peptidoglycan/xylan/chitin deacetylase (PgdA/CDA1 family)